MTESTKTSGASAQGHVASSVSDAEMWDDVGSDWIADPRDRLWRHHSDVVTSALIEGWISPGQGSILKTDLFDEAVSDGLFPALAKLGKAVHAVDVAAETVMAVRQKYPAMRTHVSDVRTLPFETQTFDVVISTSTLDHFDHEDEIHRSLREIRRVMADGGHLIITLDNPLNPKLALRAALPERLLMKAGLVPYHCGVTLPREALKRAVQDAGFDILDERAFLHCPRVFAVKIAAWIDRFASPKWERRLLSMLARFEGLERWPSRWRTGHFTALLARAR